ncbi:MAG: MBL fold metallo-hydrolase [Planctomycetes bacterium]|nr:MBL fold metallo-hydrolase [Planctomycetota bacterium]MCK5578594.1 MBL fold metallo-hydrolase [Planctomycetota bacterium]
MKVKSLVVGPIQACCYVISFENNEALVIDPGGDGDVIVDYLKKNKLKPKYLVNTHGHIDHIGANHEIKKAFPDIQICIHQADADMLTSSDRNLSTELGFEFSSPEHDRLLEENDVLAVGKRKFNVLHVPGHTRGGICLLSEPSSKKELPVIFTGDTLFAMGIGRSDFPGGSHEQLISGIKNKILTLPEETVVYSGHGPATTVGVEKAGNPWLK